MSRPPAESTRHSPPIHDIQWTVDATVLGHAGLTWEREFSGVCFERLVEVAVSATPGGSIKLKFGVLEQRPVIQGELQATVDLICQRCMGVMHYPVRETFELMLVATEAELALVPESHEPWIANAARLNVLELVEEQLLLALPLIARHPVEQSCVKVTPQLQALFAESPVKAVEQEPATEGDEVQRPFSQLRDLLRKQ